MNAEATLANARIDLPPAVAPFGAYVPAVRTGSLLFLTGMLPTVGHEPKFRGRVGQDLTADEAARAARAAALNVLATARQHLCSLDRVSRVVRLGVYIATTDDVDQVRIADAASDLLREVFGEDKISSRVVFGVSRLPLGVPVELETILEVTVVQTMTTQRSTNGNGNNRDRNHEGGAGRRPRSGSSNRRTGNS